MDLTETMKGKTMKREIATSAVLLACALTAQAKITFEKGPWKVSYE